jgi:hypothetical protein
MRSMFRSTLLVLVSLLVVGAVASASASAAPEWLLEGKPVTKSTPITFTLHFFEAWEKGGTKITCSAASGKGTVAPSGGGSITEFKLSKCWRTISGPCKSQTKAEQESTEWVRMINLSWPTKLVAKGLEAVDWVESHGGNGEGAPMGFEWECTNIFGTGKIKDKCEAGSIPPDPYGTYITSVHDEGGTVYQEFKGLLGPTPPFTCSLGGEGSGEFYATIVLKGPEGQKLTHKES